jgi:hypothetical protein
MSSITQVSEFAVLVGWVRCTLRREMAVSIALHARRNPPFGRSRRRWVTRRLDILTAGKCVPVRR